VILLAGFVTIERTAGTPITPLRLFADRDRSLSYAARLLLMGGMFGVFFFLTQFLQEVLKYSPLLTGLAFLPLTAGLFVASQLSARVLLATVGPRLLMVAGLSCSTIGVAVLAQLSQHSNYPLILAGLLLFGFGNGLAFVPLTTIALAGVDVADAGAASGLVNVMQQLGGSLGLAVLVTVFGTATRSVGTGGAAHVFVVGADQAFLGAALMLALTVVISGLVRGGRGTVPPSARPQAAPDAEFEPASAA
jgi:predicted MFS family arabinose efflux permease